jgi:hypothetical protein
MVAVRFKCGGNFMKNKALWWAVPIGVVLALVMVSAALAQKNKCKEFQGVNNAYTAQTKTTASGVTTTTGPYEVLVHGR